jgi:ATP-dependent DNA ligase
MTFRKPMLAASEIIRPQDLREWAGSNTGRYLASVKLDGVRCTVDYLAPGPSGRSGRHHTYPPIPFTRSGNVVPNRMMHRALTKLATAMPVAGLDGELLAAGYHAGTDVFPQAQKACAEAGGSLDFVVFDHMPSAAMEGTNPDAMRRQSYLRRVFHHPHGARPTIETAQKPYATPAWSNGTGLNILLADQYLVDLADPEAGEKLATFAARVMDEGYEGIILRRADSAYKHGRATATEGDLLKVKQRDLQEAEVLEVIEQTTNTNARKVSDAGVEGRRGSSKAGKVPAGTAGKFLARDLATGAEIKIGCRKGLTDADRKAIWEDRESWVGKVIQYEAAPPVNEGGLPRQAQYVGVREAVSM